MPDKLKKGWKIWRFDQMATMVNERVDNPEDAGVEYYVGLEHLDPESLTIRRWGSPSDVAATKLRFRKGDIIFGRRRVYQRKLAVAHFDGICSAHATVLRAKPDIALPDFLPFFMQSDLFMERAKQISVGSLSPTINWKTLAQEEFALPPLDEQRRIAEVLESIELQKSAINSVLYSGNTVIRALTEDHFNRYRSSCCQLSDHYLIKSGQVDPRTKGYSNLPLIAPNHIESKTGRLLKVETAKEQSAISGKYLFDKGSVLYSKIRPNLMKATIAPFQGLCSADMYVLIPKSSLNKEYLLCVLLSDRFTKFAISGSDRTGIPKLNRKHLQKFQCHVPSINIQEKFVKKWHRIQNVINSSLEYGTSLAQIKRTIHERVAL